MLNGCLCYTKKLIMRNLISVIITVAIVVILDHASDYSLKLAKKFQTHFDEKEINGEIEYIGISHHGTKFKIIGVKDEFIFCPNKSEINDFKIFTRFAEKGDTILKPAYSDSL